MNSRLNSEGAALCIDLKVGIDYQKCYYYSMPVRMRGGLAIYPEWKGERVFMTATGVKIRRVNGRYQYNPPTLKFACVRVLDRHFPDPRDGRLYTNVQNCLDQLVSLVETHLEGVEWEGIDTTVVCEIMNFDRCPPNSKVPDAITNLNCFYRNRSRWNTF